jgi:hypothetical protein
MTQNCKFRKAILSAFFNISQRNFGILLILWWSFKLWWNFCLDQNLVYNANGPLRRTQLNLIQWRLSKGASGSHLMTHVWSWSTLTVEGSVWGLSQPTLSTFPVGGNRSTRRKSTSFGRTLTDSFHTSCTSPRIESAISEVKNACSDGCAKPLAEKVLKGIEPNVSGL